ncbi:lysine--tRNA ligase [endosymbiont of Euscepes postfasciatus]|uniref:lysine--tRNA ligase n=1 Tax=endosymbiont of Euscepes postfasciatus TaxID=650377 RepID=UPI000DC73661|nr:lysine--tRNA ligase [endosymbiont of Euscepes postfasciatus]BBA84544.1 lysine--tRNA ligase [endosymbiont of Euscepes postfasciatus]
MYIENIIKKYKYFNKDYFNSNKINVITYGRLMYKRIIGKVMFFTIQDIFNSIQIYFSYNFLLKNIKLKKINIGSILKIKGYLFKTNVNELTINCNKINILVNCFNKLYVKSNLSIKENYKYKKRYLDLIVNNKSKDIFLIRSKIILEIRNFLFKKHFIEVETPILQSLIGGAEANSFKTKLDIFNKNYYLRISPELYLKKLIVGGFNKIFEIGKNFRNEGISHKHNPEFTMLELYISYKNYKYLITFIQNLIRNIYLKIFKSSILKINNINIDLLKDFNIMSIEESLIKFNKNLNIDDYKSCYNYAKSIEINIENNISLLKLRYEIFKKTVENKLIYPTFIINYPIEISPLSKRNIKNKDIADRFELFINGLEIANGFSELNNFKDQILRFKKQNKFKKNKSFDKNYIDALKYGLPPTSGIGIGIDRLIMILANINNIKDVILFPSTRYKEI